METFLKGIEDETLQKDIEADAGMCQFFPSSRLGLRAKPENVTIGQNKARKSRDALPAFF